MIIHRTLLPIGVHSTILFLLLVSSNPISSITAQAFLLSPLQNQYHVLPSLITKHRSSSRLFQSKEALAREGDWAAFLDEETTGLVYYFNMVTGESVWDAPTPTFPTISMSKRKKEKMMTKRREYFESQQQIPQQQEEKRIQTNKKSNRMENTSSSSSSITNNPLLLGGLLSNMAAKDKKLFSEAMESRPLDMTLSNTDTLSSSSSSSSTDEAIEDSKSKSGSTASLFDRFFTRPSKQSSMTGSSVVTDTSFNEEDAPYTPVSNNIEQPATTVEAITDTQKLNFFNRFFPNNALDKMSSTDMSSTIPKDSIVIDNPSTQRIIQDSTTTSSNTLNLRDFQDTTKQDEVFDSNTKSPTQSISKKKGITKRNPFFRKSIQEDDPVNGMPVDSTSGTDGTKTELQIDMVSKVLPHPDKVSWGGEDATFCSGRSFGVFDGVSGADKEEGKPLYSVTLANQLKESLETRGGLSINQLKAELMDASLFADTCATGATTALVASIGTDGFLRVINLGDSVLMVIRDDKILVKTKERIHYFDCPYQLSNGSPDRPRDATSLQVELLPGDIIIAGSDGVFDNLTESTVRKIVTGVTTAKVNLGLIAKKIVDQSRSVSLDPQAKTPYALMAKQNRYEAYESGLGGKVDDISCVVARCT